MEDARSMEDARFLGHFGPMTMPAVSVSIGSPEPRQLMRRVRTMTFDFRLTTVDFDPTAGQIQTESKTVGFGRHINRATAAINGFDVRYTNGEHPTLRQIVDISTVTFDNNNQTVTVTARLLIRDNSGNIDDPFRGTVRSSQRIGVGGLR